MSSYNINIDHFTRYWFFFFLRFKWLKSYFRLELCAVHWFNQSLVAPLWLSLSSLSHTHMHTHRQWSRLVESKNWFGLCKVRSNLNWLLEIHIEKYSNPNCGHPRLPLMSGKNRAENKPKPWKTDPSGRPKLYLCTRITAKIKKTIPQTKLCDNIMVFIFKGPIQCPLYHKLIWFIGVLMYKIKDCETSVKENLTIIQPGMLQRQGNKSPPAGRCAASRD